MKIPYHRVHQVQDTSWLNKNTRMKTVLQFAPTKGESQVAFHRSAQEVFTLGVTNLSPRAKNAGQKKGYGQRNKSYMFKDGEICAADSKICQCAEVIEGNEQDYSGNISATSYTKTCGLILRLWNYPTPQVVHTGLSPQDEVGFFYFHAEHRAVVEQAHPNKSECFFMRKDLVSWTDELTAKQRKKYQVPEAEKYREEAEFLYLTESCFRAEDRELAQQETAQAIEAMLREKKDSSKSLCMNLRPSSSDSRRQRYYLSFDEKKLQAEKALFTARSSSSADSSAVHLKALVEDLVSKADQAVKRGVSYKVTDKKRLPNGITEKRYYFSIRPHDWFVEDLSEDVKAEIAQSLVKVSEATGLLYREGQVSPGSVIGGPHDDYYDRAPAWYMADNVTTLSLAWHFTGDLKYAKYAADLVDTFFLNPKTAMLPSLDYAEAGERFGFVDWKEMYVLIDAFVMLEKAGALSSRQVSGLQRWMQQLLGWYTTSRIGRRQVLLLSSRGMYVDLTTLAIASYAKMDDAVDLARWRLHYRLSKPAPLGHFGPNGEQPHESAGPNALHDMAFNLAGWVHAALVVEAVRANSELPGSMASLWWVREEGESKAEDPVLMKALRYLLQFLPTNPAAYTAKMSLSKAKLDTKFPYQQEEPFAFDRLLELLHHGVHAYSMNRLLGDLSDRRSEAVKLAIQQPLHATALASFSKYSSVTPDTAMRMWPSLGISDQKYTYAWK
jgi:hypothetical protein